MSDEENTEEMLSGKITFPDQTQAVVRAPTRALLEKRIGQVRKDYWDRREQLKIQREIEELPELQGEPLDDFKPHPDMPSLQPESRPGISEKGPFWTPVDEVTEITKGAILDVLALGEVGVVSAENAAVNVIGNAFGAVALATGYYAGSDDPIGDEIRDVNTFTNLLGIDPLTERGTNALMAIVPPLLAIENGADWLAEFLTTLHGGPGNPIAQTMIKTTLLAPLELLPPVKGSIATWRGHRIIAQNMKEIKKMADYHGLPIGSGRGKNANQPMEGNVSKLFESEASGHRGEAAVPLADELRRAERIARDNKNAAFEMAKRRNAFVQVVGNGNNNTRYLSQYIEAQLKDMYLGFGEMTKVREALDILSGKTLDAQGSFRVHMRNWEGTRQRIIQTAKTTTGPEQSALNYMRAEMDRWMDLQYDQAAIKIGAALLSEEAALVGGKLKLYPKQGTQRAPGNVPAVQTALSGEIDALKAFKDARYANAVWRRNFYDDKVIANLIHQEATAAQYAQWLIGSSALGSRRQAASTIRRMKQALGPDHPAIHAIRKDILFEIGEPLFALRPGEAGSKNRTLINRFINNYDMIKRRNKELMKELGIDDLTHWEDLYTLAKTTSRMPPAKQAGVLENLIASVTRLTAGNEMAQSAVRVNWFRQFANALLLADPVSRKSLIMDMANIQYGVPLIPPTSVTAAEFIAGAALTSTPQILDEETPSQGAQ